MSRGVEKLDHSKHNLAQVATLLWSLTGPLAIFGLIVPAGPEPTWFFVWQWVFFFATGAFLIARFWEHSLGRGKRLIGHASANWLHFILDTILVLMISAGIWSVLHWAAHRLAG